MKKEKHCDYCCDENGSWPVQFMKHTTKEHDDALDDIIRIKGRAWAEANGLA